MRVVRSTPFVALAAIIGPLLIGAVLVGFFAVNDPNVVPGELGLYLLRVAGIVFPICLALCGIGGMLSAYTILVVQEFIRPVSFIEAVGITVLVSTGLAWLAGLVPVPDLDPEVGPKLIPFPLACAAAAAAVSTVVGALSVALGLVVPAER